MLLTYTEQVQDQEVKEWINTTLNAYLKKNEENQSEIEHILDFLTSDRAPKRLRRMSYVQAKEGSAKWLKSLIKKGNNITEVEGKDITVEIDFKDGFKLVKLVSSDSFKREGNLMGHCVASYFGKEGEVYSLRDSRNQPHCTIEVQGGRNDINQVKGKGNGSIHPAYVEYIMKSLEHFGMNIRESELRNLGYEDLEEVTPGLTKFLKDNFMGIKTKSFDGIGELFYANSKLKRISEV